MVIDLTIDIPINHVACAYRDLRAGILTRAGATIILTSNLRLPVSAAASVLASEPGDDTIARDLCTRDGWEHHDQTDDYPCSACKADAEVLTAAAGHFYRLERRLNDLPGNHPAAPQHRHACSCGFATTWFNTRIHKNPQEKPTGCPMDPTVRGLTTLQFANGGLFDATPVDYLIHLVRTTNRGTPGATLCNIDRFAKDSAGWSVGGGLSGGSIKLSPCDGCADTATTEFPGLPVCGSVGGTQMAQRLGVEYRSFFR